VRFSSVNATHKIVCSSESQTFEDRISGEKRPLMKMEFYKFVHFDGMNYFDSLPFDHVLLQDDKGKYSVVAIENVNFELIEI
jgi:hypothetical protein